MKTIKEGVVKGIAVSVQEKRRREGGVSHTMEEGSGTLLTQKRSSGDTRKLQTPQHIADPLHILEAVIHTTTTLGKEVIIVKIDVAKAFDKIHRDAVKSFAKTIIAPIAPEAAAFINGMYEGDEVALSYGKATRSIKMESGIRQGDPLSPALFSALVGHVMGPLISK